MVFWHQFYKYMLAVFGDDFGAAGVPEALQRLTLVLSVGIIGPNKRGYVKKIEQSHRV